VGIAALRLWLTLAGGLLALVTVLTLNTPTLERELAPVEVEPLEGHAYSASIMGLGGFPYSQVSRDRMASPRGSRLVVFEDGKALGPALAPLETIIEAGGGAYSFHKGRIYFSTTDGSDPRTSRHSYWVKAPAQVHPVFTWVLLVLAGLAAGAGVWHLLGRPHENRQRAGAVWSALAVALGLAIALLSVLAPTVEERIDPGRFSPRMGHAYEVALGTLIAFPFAVSGDGFYWQDQSPLELLEDGRPLGPAHALHADIETAGRGAYSHWNVGLILSASDGSDPRSNGREYRVRAQAGVHPVLWWMFLCASTVAAYLLVGQSDPWRFRRVFCGLDDRPGWAWTAAFATACVAGAAFLLLRNWETARSVSLSAAGFLPLSDALAYWSCASEIASTGELTQFPDVCGGRVTYSSVLAALLGLTNWHPHLMYLAQAVLVALAVAGLALQTARLAGLAGGVLAGLLLLAFANDHAIGVTMTEVAGLTAGASALALLLYGAERAKPVAVVAGLALLSIAQVSRSGAMLILPAAFLWVVLVAPRLGMRRWSAIGVAALALASGFVLQLGLVRSFHVNTDASFGNFSMVLYGLSVGGKGWGQVYKDHPELFPEARDVSHDREAPRIGPVATQEKSNLAATYREVYALAFANIRSAPSIFIGACLDAAGQYPRYIYNFVPSAPQSWWFLQGLLLLGLAWCLYHWRSPVSLLLLAMIAAEMASAPLITDGGIRIFAGSIGLRVVLAALGLRMVASLLWPRQSPLAEEFAAGSRRVPGSPVLAATVGSLLVGLAQAPATGLLGLARLPPVPAPTCQPGEELVVARLDRESATLTLVAEALDARLFPLAVHQGPLVAGMSGTWFMQDFAALTPSVTLVNAVRREANDLGRSRGMIIEQRPAWLTPGTMVRACLAPNDYVAIAQRRYLRAHSLKPVQAQPDRGQTQQPIPLSEAHQ
jgi:hypothetical protein